MDVCLCARASVCCVCVLLKRVIWYWQVTGERNCCRTQEFIFEIGFPPGNSQRQQPCHYGSWIAYRRPAVLNCFHFHRHSKDYCKIYMIQSALLFSRSVFILQVNVLRKQYLNREYRVTMFFVNWYNLREVPY